MLAAVAAKGVKELTYHRDFAGRWFLTLARGTAESRRRLLAGLDALWPYWSELFETHDVERAAARSGVGVDPAGVAADVDAVLDQVLAASGVDRPDSRAALAAEPADRAATEPAQGPRRRTPRRSAAARRDAGGRSRAPQGAVVSRARQGRPSSTDGRGHASVAAAVVDPELPMLTLVDLGVLRDVDVDEDGAVVAAITPTYSGCPAMAAMRDDLVRELRAAGFADARVRVVLDPAWTTDWITPAGRAALAAAGISPPGPAPHRSGPVPLAARADAARRPLPAVRVGRRRGRLGVRLHRLQGACTAAGPAWSRSTT